MNFKNFLKNFKKNKEDYVEGVIIEVDNLKSNKVIQANVFKNDEELVKILMTVYNIGYNESTLEHIKKYSSGKIVQNYFRHYFATYHEDIECEYDWFYYKINKTSPYMKTKDGRCFRLILNDNVF